MVSGKLNKDLLEDIVSEIQAVKQPEEVRGLYLFCSIDICNSTQIKSQNDNWKNEFVEFFKSIHSELLEAEIGWQFWKTIGDEILFYQFIDKITSETLKESLTKLAEAQKEAETTKKIKSKCTAWIATCHENSTVGNNNFIIPADFTAETNTETVDFIGKDIDEGFRLAKKADGDGITITAKLAYLLLKLEQKGLEENLSILQFVYLKGIWGGKPYPVFLYHQENYDQNRAYDEQLKYDIEKYRSYCKSDKIEKMYQDNDNLKELKSIDDFIAGMKSTDLKKVLFEKIPKQQLFIHGVALCQSEIDNVEHYLMFQRKKSKQWDFGCVKFSVNTNWCETIKEKYASELGVAIDLIEARPLKSYQTKKGNGGIMYLAKVVNTELVKEHELIKYIKAKWFTASEIFDMEANEQLIPELLKDIEGEFDNV